MKRTLFILAFFMISFAHAGQDREGSERPAIWRATMTCIPQSHVLFSTRAVFVYSVRVASASTYLAPATVVGAFAMFNTTMTPSNSAYVAQSSYAYTLTGVPQTEPLSLSPVVVATIFQAGAVVNKTNAACVEILWDFLSPTTDPYLPWRP